MTSRHTNTIIELALLDNRQNQKRPEVHNRAVELGSSLFAEQHCSVHIDLGRAAGHSRYAVRQWLDGAFLVVSSLPRIAQLSEKHKPTIQQIARLLDSRSWLRMGGQAGVLGVESDLVIFDPGSIIVDAAILSEDGSYGRLFWPSAHRLDTTYLFLG